MCLEKAGITQHMRPYEPRQGIAIAAGVDYGTVAALMGHISLMMVLKHYQHVKNALKVRIMEQMPHIVLVDPVCPKSRFCMSK